MKIADLNLIKQLELTTDLQEIQGIYSYYTSGMQPSNLVHGKSVKQSTQFLAINKLQGE